MKAIRGRRGTSGIGPAVLLFTGFGLAIAAGRGGRDVTGAVTSGDGVRIVYEVQGEGATAAPALVFVHGWSCDRTCWAGQFHSFSREFKVVALDLAGHGDSGLGRRYWTMGAFGGDVAAVVDQLGLQRLILIGHSMGGDVVAEAARRLPDRVAGLIWVDTCNQLGTPRTPEEIQSIMAPLRADFVAGTRAFARGLFRPTAAPALVERVAEDMSLAPPEVALACMESALGYGREMPRTLQELKLPVIAINPDEPPTDTASLSRYGVEVVTMPGAGHFLMMEDPGRFNALLRAAIEKLAVGRSQPPSSSGGGSPAASATDGR